MKTEKYKCMDGQAEVKINTLKVDYSVGFAYVRI